MKSIDKERMTNKMKVIVIVFIGLMGVVLVGTFRDDIWPEEVPEAKVISEQIYTIQDLKWIEGVWLDSTAFSFRTPKVSFMEKWKCYPDSISGKGISIKENDTTITSALCIREVNGEIKYIARPAGEAMIPFSLIFMNDNEAVFENPVNDFPQKIRYLKTTKDSLQVIISGLRPEGERSVTFKMRSVSF